MKQDRIGKYAEIFRAYTGISVEGTEEKTKSLSQDSLCPD
jgi:hypothetical protein